MLLQLASLINRLQMDEQNVAVLMMSALGCSNKHSTIAKSLPNCGATAVTFHLDCKNNVIQARAILSVFNSGSLCSLLLYSHAASGSETSSGSIVHKGFSRHGQSAVVINVVT